ncbi:MAG: GIY-YIG nuclease family protein [Elainella sp. Prado103]|nr:GIY-YIG nuclease family protein [Elainella sp. Prado103]
MPFSTLTQLDYLPVLDEAGQLPEQVAGKVGVYAIFDRDQQLQYIGYSRDVLLSVKQHLVRRPQSCYWLKVQTVERPSRTVLEELRSEWFAEMGELPPGNREEAESWSQPIDVKPRMTAAEQSAYQMGDEQEQIKILKQVARRIEAAVLSELTDRGVQFPVRFDPKAKEFGLLDLK